MNTRTKKQITILIAVAVVLILAILAAIILMPSGTVKRVIPGSTDQKPDGTPVSTERFDATGRFYGADGKPLANVTFGISIGPTDFTTDENGYFRLNGLPVGVYELYGYDSDGSKVGTVVFQVSTDGCITVGYTFYEQGELVTLRFANGVIEPYTPPASSSGSTGGTVGNMTSSQTPSSGTADTPAVEEGEDETYTNFSWMKDVPFEFGCYGLEMTWSIDIFYAMVNDPQYDYINTFLLRSDNIETTKLQAKVLKEKDKNIWLNVGSLLSLGSSDVNANLPGDWRTRLDRWASELAAIAGDNFQGFYFDEVDLFMNSRDFTRVTKYMRENFGLRTFAVHRLAMVTIPASKGMSIIGYHPAADEFVITPDNHKYVTDVGYWWYGGYRFYNFNAESVASIWKDAMSMLDPNTRKWLVPPMGTYDFRHNEEDCMGTVYEMYKACSDVEGFGGLLFYSMAPNTLWGGVGHISPDDERLTDDDFLKDENGDFVLDADGNRIVHLKENNSYTGVVDGSYDTTWEGCGYYFVCEQQPDGSYRWPRARQYFEIIGKGIVNGVSRDSILSQLEAVFTPDRSTYLSFR